MGPFAGEELDGTQSITERLGKLGLDPTFVVDVEHRAKFGANPDEDDIPVLDLSPFRRICELDGHAALGRAALEHDSALQDLVADVGKACENWGFFQVVNHGVPLGLLDNLEKVAQQFFDLPLAEKRKCRRTFERYLGYYESELTKNKRDWKEVFDFACSGSMESPKEVNGDQASEETIKCENQWPENPPALRPACEEWSKAVESLASDMLGLISLSLGLPFSHFSHHFKENTSVIRLNYYPKCPIPDLALGVSRHKDSGALTVLVQDEVGGLQVRRKDGEWISVKPRRDAFVINVGDLFQVRRVIHSQSFGYQKCYLPY